MTHFKKALAASLLSAFALLGATSSQAATVTFDFNAAVPAPFVLNPDSPGIVGGDCQSGNCLGVNSQGAARLSVTTGTFSVVSFWLKLLGNGTNLIVSTDKGTFNLGTGDHGRDGKAADLTGNALFQEITYLSFLTSKGNARIDDISVSYGNVAPVPLPASALLLLGGLGGLAALRRRKAAV